MDKNAIRIINKLDWESLSCLDRSLAFLFSLSKKNGYLPFLLSKYSSSNYLCGLANPNHGDKAYYDLMAKKAGLCLERVTCAGADLLKTLTDNDNITHGIVLLINNYYRPLSKHYQIKDHPHFVLLYGYNKDKKTIMVFDEPMEKEYWKKENFALGVEYVEREMPLDNILSYAKKCDGFAKELDFSIEEDSFYFYMVSASDNRPVSEKELLIDELRCLLATKDEHVQYVEKELNIFSKHLDNWLANIDLENLETIEKISYCPNEWVLLRHHKNMMRVLASYFEEMAMNNFSLQFNDLFDSFRTLSTVLALVLLNKEKERIGELEKRFISLLDREYALLKSVLDSFQYDYKTAIN